MASKYKKKLNLEAPSTGQTQESDIKYTIDTYSEKLVCEYSHIPMDRIQKLNIFVFWQLLRDAIIYQAEQTEDGQDWLKRCWAAEQTEPDRETLRKFFQKK